VRRALPREAAHAEQLGTAAGHVEVRGRGDTLPAAAAGDAQRAGPAVELAPDPQLPGPDAAAAALEPAGDHAIAPP
jgi:hypothetical protein